jgi:hypothetical protein
MQALAEIRTLWKSEAEAIDMRAPTVGVEKVSSGRSLACIRRQAQPGAASTQLATVMPQD